MKLAIGVDPGASGALAFYDGTRLEVADMPTVRLKRGNRTVNHTDAAMLSSHIDGLLGAYEAEAADCHAFVEKVGAMPGQGVSSMFAFGRAAGVIEGVLAGLDIPFTLITPQTWQGFMGLIKQGKDGTRAKAARIFPKQADMFKRKKDDGRADAAMLACYGYNRVPRGDKAFLPAMGQADAYVESCIVKEGGSL